MEVDARMLLTIAGMLASIVSAFIIVKTKLQAVIEEIGDFEARIRALDKSTDAQEISIQNHRQRLGVLSQMLSPAEREADARETAGMLAEISFLRAEVDKLTKMHNGTHPTPP